MDDEPLKSVRRPKALVRLSSPNRSTSTIDVRDMYAAEKKNISDEHQNLGKLTNKKAK